jgi:pimeloyl-ACP methyl ester carboxylesterase
MAVLIGLLVGPAARASAPLPVPYTYLAGLIAGKLTPGADPPGANDWSCRPSADHPDPVVLLHGFLSSMTDAWQTAAPLLHNRGYCVFALTYGTDPSVDPSGSIGGLARIQDSSHELAAFVSRVLGATGASKVDLVGWSEGGWLGRQYIQFDGGDRTVRRYVGLAPANGPTNVSQLVFALSRQSPAFDQFRALVASAVGKLVPLAEQAADPDLFAQLNVGGGTSANVTYTNIATDYDELVPPSSAFIPRGAHVTDIVVQDGCPIDLSDHLAIASTRRAMAMMLNALDPTHPVSVPCLPVLPVIGGF